MYITKQVNVVGDNAINGYQEIQSIVINGMYSES